jgi:hypothetical protein
MRWSEAGYLSRIVLTHAPRQVSISLILDVRQKPMKRKLIALVISCVAFAAGVIFERHRANSRIDFEAQLSALIPVSEYYRANAPAEAAERMNHVYHIAVLNLVKAADSGRADSRDERLRRILTVIKSGRERAGLSLFDSNHFSPAIGPETMLRIDEFMK